MKTVRQEILAMIRYCSCTAQDISKMVSIREKEVYEHLKHIEKSVGAYGEKLIIYQSKCLSCGFEFKKRTRLTTPGRCPVCKKESITRPVFKVEPEKKR